MPVAKSRPRALRTPIASMAPAPTTPPATKPNSGLTPARNAPEPPAVATSASEWPANDCPRRTVKTPTTPDTTATMVPMRHATWTGWLTKKPGSNNQRTSDRSQCRVGREPGLLHRPGHHENAPVERVDVDFVSVQRAQHVVAHHLFGGPAGGATPGEIDDAVHYGQQGVHLVGGKEDGNLLLGGDPVEQGHDLLA